MNEQIIFDIDVPEPVEQPVMFEVTCGSTSVKVAHRDVVGRYAGKPWLTYRGSSPSALTEGATGHASLTAARKHAAAQARRVERARLIHDAAVAAAAVLE